MAHPRDRPLCRPAIHRQKHRRVDGTYGFVLRSGNLTFQVGPAVRGRSLAGSVEYGAGRLYSLFHAPCSVPYLFCDAIAQKGAEDAAV